MGSSYICSGSSKTEKRVTGETVASQSSLNAIVDSITDSVFSQDQKMLTADYYHVA